MADNFLKGLLGAAQDDQFRADLKNGLFDLGKGASRSAGQMVTGGVDLMSLLLSPLGYNNPAPVGSTAWAEQKGMIPKAEYTNRLAGLLGEGLGGVAPMVAQAKAPQIANGLLTIADNAAKSSPMNALSRKQAGAINVGGAQQYGIEHRPMTDAGGAARLHDLEQSFGADIYGPNALQFFGSGDPREKSVVGLMRAIKGKPDAPVTIYRGVPEGVNTINPGDWITLDPRVAADYGRVVKMQVPASHITSWPDSLLEFGYYPPTK